MGTMKLRLLFVFLLVLMTVSQMLIAQDRTISGTVISQEDGTGLPGVNVIVKGTNQGTVTDVEGAFKISLNTNDAILVFSFIGYVTEEIGTNSRSVIDVQMKQDLKQLQEVVVTGYREENRRALPGSIAIVKSDKIQNIPIASFDQVLQGRVPGMLVLGGSGQPGAAASVVIRGIKSLSGSNGPLYVIDGVPVAAGVFNTLNTNDFESIAVLKDASSAAIYGSRGANGVILITTKRGKDGDTQINYGFQYGISQAPTNKLEVMNSKEKIDFELQTGGSPLATYTSEKLNRLRKIDTNWEDVLFQSAATQSHDLSIQGGTAKTQFFISGNYFDQQGTVKETGLKRYTAKINLTSDMSNFKYGMNSSFGYSENQTTLEGNAYIGSPLNAVRWSNPYEKPYDSIGGYTKIRSGQPNALQELEQNRRKFFDVKGVMNMFGEYALPFVKGLAVKTSWGVDYTQRETDNYYDKATYTGIQTPGQSGSVTRGSSLSANFIGTNSISYKTVINNDHEVFASLYHEIVSNKSKGFSYTGYGISGNLKNDGGTTVSATFLPDIGGSRTESAIQSIFSEVSYGYKNRYNFKGGLRRDASSRFGKDKRYATFYSAGVNWRISEEAFMQNLTSKITFLKAYTNIGTSGNQSGIGDFGSLSLFDLGFSYDGTAGVRQTQPDNSNLGWETVRSFNAGVEYSLFANRISGTIEYYINSTLDLLLEAQQSRTSGFPSITQNVGKMRNRGIEIDITGGIYKTRNFFWNVNANFTYNRNEILKLVETDQIVGGLTISKVGLPARTNYLVEYLGVNPANGDALYRTKDGGITNQFSTDDLKPFGSRIAPRFGGLTNTFNYKGIELSVFFSFVQGSKVFNNDRTNVENPTFYVDNLSKDLLNAWKKPGDITNIPRIQTTSGLTTNAFQAQTTRYLEDGSFLRLRNVSLSYNLPPEWLSKAKLRSVRVFALGQNLWTLSKFRGWDPEFAGGQLTGAQYPALRTVTAGVNVGF